MGEGVLAELASLGVEVPVLNLGIPDAFVSQGKPADLLRALGLDAEGIEASIRTCLG